ncbi:glycoside hydrolase family 16 protein [Corallococcus llansteffanensis]|uniref:Glycoside hydrolase family 16 protein n=1 Tax=Corallococcus llansteffanensis TaxID=2316731 RepID=A0A3A8QE91_9BACT|nr:glycoside hydrolase family 16 protein [Corallococcus llansteffanensis]RKH66957.1 glycoside hydrolase family 16 protein [Corallococcus llansteffanensis]
MTSRRFLFALALSGLGTLACDPAAGIADKQNEPPKPDTVLPGTGWTLIWQDEFEGSAGTLPAKEKWAPDVGGDGWGNGQYEFNTARAENASLDGEGNLAITARRERYGNNDYTSARLNTKGRFQHAYGRYEARIKLPTGRGIWPAFWLLGADVDTKGWPACGEVDIMEHRGQIPSIVTSTLHGPGYSGGQSVGREHAVGGGTLQADFHVYAVEWEPERLRFILDDTVFFEATPDTLPAGKKWVYDHPFFIILNVAVGGSYVGPPDAKTVFPQTMKVDYVRVYEKATP